jgi:uncharacterized membrane protein
MSSKTVLIALFGCIFVGLSAYNLHASTLQAVWQWGGLTSGPDRYWTRATFVDAYCGFLTFYVFVYYKERIVGRIGWFVAIMLLGNVAMSFYMLLCLKRLKPGEPVSGILVRQQ